MKKTIKLALAASMVLGASSAFATNGSNLISVGAKARGMGGVGIGMSHGAESALANPALISTVEGTEIQFGGTLFMPDVENENSVNLGGLGDESSSATSTADLSVIPSISIATKVNENFYWGIGMWGTAGMGVDYRGTENTGQLNMVTNLQLMQFGVPLTYARSGFSVGITPVLQYGALDINYAISDALMTLMTGGAMTTGTTVGAGIGQDLQFGVNVGVAYEIAGVTMGASYKSQIDMDYENVLSTTLSPFTPAGYTNNKLSTPAEIGVGVSYKLAAHSIALDYKQIKWSSAKGYQDFGWDDQNVFALGYEYAAKSWAARAGYNYAKSPISEQSTNFTPAGDTSFNSAGINGSTANTLNLLGFPATTTSHLTLGGTYGFNEKASVDLAFVYAPQVEDTYTNFANQDITTKHSQKSVSVGLNYNF